MPDSRKIKWVALLTALLLLSILHINSDSVIVLSIVNLVSLLALGNCVRLIQGRLLSPFMLIVASLYVFHSGHLWLSLLNSNPDSFLLSFDWYKASNIHYIIETYKGITSLLIIFMVVGAFSIKPIVPDNETDCIDYSVTRQFKYGFLILYLLAFYFEVLRAISVSNLGYGDGYHYGNTIAQYVVFSVDVFLLMLLYIYRKNPKQFKYYLILDIAKILFVMFFVGNRGSSVINLLIIVFIITNYSYLAYNRRKLRSIMLSVFAFLILALPLISATRGERSNMGLSEFVNTGSPIESFLEEFGGTVYNVFLTQDYISAIGTAHGLQILGTTLSILPGSTMLFGDIITTNVSIGSMLNIYNNRQGLGGSMIAQLYFNFGDSIFLFISMAIIAFAVSAISNRLMKGNTGLYKTILLLSLFSGFMTFVRGEWYDVVTEFKVCVYLVIILYVFRNQIFIKK